jgi:hypothetical protein
MEGNWTGVKLKTLLEAATPSEAAIKVAFYADDGYSTDLTVETAMRDDIIIAYEKDGATLDNLRLVVPGKWGYKWINQLTRIELVDYNFLGFWENRGYPDEADVTAGSQSTNQLPPVPPKTDNPSPPPTASPEITSSPTPSPPPDMSPSPFDQYTPTPEPSENIDIPKEVVYAIAVSVIAVVVVSALTLARKSKAAKS